MQVEGSKYGLNSYWCRKLTAYQKLTNLFWSKIFIVGVRHKQLYFETFKRLLNSFQNFYLLCHVLQNFWTLRKKVPDSFFNEVLLKTYNFHRVLVEEIYKQKEKSWTKKAVKRRKSLPCNCANDCRVVELQLRKPAMRERKVNWVIVCVETFSSFMQEVQKVS